MPYARNEKLARSWAFPGKAGLEHRVGGLEKDKLKGSISIDPQNHQEMTNLRAAKIAKIADYIPHQTVTATRKRSARSRLGRYTRTPAECRR